METTVGFSIQVKNESEDFLRVPWFGQKRRLLGLAWVPILIVGAFIFAALTRNPSDPENDRRWIIYIGSILVPLFVIGVMYFLLKRQAEQMATAAESTTVFFDKNSMEISGVKATANTNWAAFEKVVETQTDFIFYPARNVYFGIPKRSFENAVQLEQLKGFLVENLGDRAILRSNI
jgi:hypothetical protein